MPQILIIYCVQNVYSTHTHTLPFRILGGKVGGVYGQWVVQVLVMLLVLLVLALDGFSFFFPS